MKDKEPGLDNKEELVVWARKNTQYIGSDDPKEATEHLMNYGLCPIFRKGKIFIESWG